MAARTLLMLLLLLAGAPASSHSPVEAIDLSVECERLEGSLQLTIRYRNATSSARTLPRARAPERVNRGGLAVDVFDVAAGVPLPLTPFMDSAPAGSQLLHPGDWIEHLVHLRPSAFVGLKAALRDNRELEVRWQYAGSDIVPVASPTASNFAFQRKPLRGSAELGC